MLLLVIDVDVDNGTSKMALEVAVLININVRTARGIFLCMPGPYSGQRCQSWNSDRSYLIIPNLADSEQLSSVLVLGGFGTVLMLVVP